MGTPSLTPALQITPCTHEFTDVAAHLRSRGGLALGRVEGGDERAGGGARGEGQAVVDDEALAQDDEREDADQADAEHVGHDALHVRLVHVLGRHAPRQ